MIGTHISHGKLREAIATLQADDAPTERECGYQDAIDKVLRIIDALAAAPQPAPADREALAKLIREAEREWYRHPSIAPSPQRAIADALLDRGLHL